MDKRDSTQPSCAQYPWLKGLLFIGFISGLSLALRWQALEFLFHPWQRGAGYDFFHYYATLEALKSALANIYDPSLMYPFSSYLSAGMWQICDNHPLPFYLLYLPFSQWPFKEAYLAHNLWQYLSYLAALLLLSLNFLRPYSPRGAWITWGVLGLASLGWGPLLDSLWLGQVSGLYLLALSLVLVGAYRRQDAYCGLGLALAILLKLYPLFLALWLVVHKRYRALGWTAGSLLLLSMAAALQWGGERFLQYVHYLLWQQPYQTVISNQSLMALLNNLLIGCPPALIKFLNLLLLGGGGYLLWRRSQRSAKEITELKGAEEGLAWGVDFSRWLVLSLILSPLSWGHHHLVLIIPFLIFLAQTWLKGTALSFKSGEAWLWGALWIIDGESFHNPSTRGLIIWLFSYKFILVLLLLLEARLWPLQWSDLKDKLLGKE